MVTFIVRGGDEFASQKTPGFPTLRPLAEAGGPPAASESVWRTFVLAAIVFGLAIAGMAVGVIVANRRIRGSCGGLAGLQDERGNPLCEACTQPAEECREFRQQIANRADAPPSTDPAPRT